MKSITDFFNLLDVTNIAETHKDEINRTTLTINGIIYTLWSPTNSICEIQFVKNYSHKNLKLYEEFFYKNRYYSSAHEPSSVYYDIMDDINGSNIKSIKLITKSSLFTIDNVLYKKDYDDGEEKAYFELIFYPPQKQDKIYVVPRFIKTFDLYYIRYNKYIETIIVENPKCEIRNRHYLNNKKIIKNK